LFGCFHRTFNASVASQDDALAAVSSLDFGHESHAISIWETQIGDKKIQVRGAGAE